MFKDNGETWEDVFEAELVSIGKGKVVWTSTFTPSLL
jgi:hypothetical protein